MGPVIIVLILFSVLITVWYCFCNNLCPTVEKAMAPHSSTLAWKIPWTEGPGGLQSMGSLGVRHDWVTSLFHFHALEKEMATHSSVLAWRIPGTGEPGGLPSMGSRRVGHDWSDLAAAAACPTVIVFFSYRMTCVILVPWPGVTAVKVPSPTQRTAREFPH